MASKRFKYTIIPVLICLLILMSGCGINSGDGDNGNNTRENGKLKIFTTIYPVYFFTSSIAADKGEVINLVPAGGEAHHWEPSPKDVVEMNHADAVIFSGAGMEAWIDDILTGLNEGVKAVDCSENIELLSVGGSQHLDGTHEASVDPHIWMDPVNATVMVENITKALCELDPENAQVFKQRGDALIKRLTDLDEEFRKTLQGLNSKKMVVSHAAFGYMAKRYGLEQISVRGISPEVEPGPARLAEIIDTIRQNDIKCIFVESLVSPKISETIAGETGVKTLVLYTLGGISKEDEQSGEDYFSLMQKNLAHLREGLGG
jgi:zinc transport system substrate-binding protein